MSKSGLFEILEISESERDGLLERVRRAVTPADYRLIESLIQGWARLLEPHGSEEYVDRPVAADDLWFEN